MSLSDVGEMLAYTGFWRMAGRHIGTGAREIARSLSRGAFLKALRRLAPDLRARDLRPAGSGVRAQAVDRRGDFVDDFLFATAGRFVHVLNVPSPAATASLVIGKAIVERLAGAFDLEARR